MKYFIIIVLTLFGQSTRADFFSDMLKPAELNLKTVEAINVQAAAKFANYKLKFRSSK